MSRWSLPLVLAAGLCCLAAPATSSAQEEGGLELPFQTEGEAAIGDRASVAIPPGLGFLDGPTASQVVRAMGNLSGGDELGMIGPSEDLWWFVVYFFDDIGYVKTDEEQLDADEMLEEMRENLEVSNEMRRDEGLEELHLEGWAIEPRYDPQTNVLEWAETFSSESGTSVNYRTRVLGRRGVMRVILVTDPERLDDALVEYRAMMKGFEFADGERYAQWVDGDKVAEYGLAALVVGGAGALAVKSGLLTTILIFFKKGWKLLVVALVAGAGFIKSIFAKLFRRG